MLLYLLFSFVYSFGVQTYILTKLLSLPPDPLLSSSQIKLPRHCKTYGATTGLTTDGMPEHSCRRLHAARKRRKKCATKHSETLLDYLACISFPPLFTFLLRCGAKDLLSFPPCCPVLISSPPLSSPALRSGHGVFLANGSPGLT